jgi:hypothetical protein
MIPLLPVPLMEQIIRYYNLHGIRSTIHVSSELRSEEAIFAGADSLAHPVIQGPVSDSFVKLMAAKKIPFASTLTIGGRSISNFVEDIAASTPAVFAVDDGLSTRLALTNDLGVPIGVRVYDPSTNAVTLSQVSGIGPVNKAAVVSASNPKIMCGPDAA